MEEVRCRSWRACAEGRGAFKNDHLGWKHAESLDEARDSRAMLRSTLGNPIARISEKPMENDRYYGYDENGNRIFTLAEDQACYILIPEWDEVTDEEMGEVYASLGVTDA